MTTEGPPVRLVLLGAADTAPVCAGDVCDLPESTVDLPATPAPDDHDPPAARGAMPRSAGTVCAP